jgi:tetratricopeptide (TPR) repeat protein
MADLFKGLIQVKDPLTLFAFVTLVMLAAFRTKGVPQLFLKLVLGGLGPDQKSLLLKGFMRYGFAAFVLVCGIAGAGQVLAYAGRNRPYSVEEVQKQIDRSETAAPQKQAAAAAYAKGLSLLDKGQFDLAIQCLQDSLDAVPTLAAQYTIALAYRDKKDTDNAAKFAAGALVTAKSQGDPLAVVRAEQLVKSTATAPVAEGAAPHMPPANEPSGNGKPGMLGPKSPFPTGGKSFDDATSIKAGRYIWTEHLDEQVFRYYRINLKAGQTLSIDFKTPNTVGPSGRWVSGGASIYDGNGAVQADGYLINARSEMKSINWTAPTSGPVYLSVGNSAGAQWPNDPEMTYVIWVQ